MLYKIARTEALSIATGQSKVVTSMKLIIVFTSIFLISCASSIIDGEYVRISSESYTPKDKNAIIEIYLAGKTPKLETINIGRVAARAWKLEKGMNELKKQARELGADAITNIIYERRFSLLSAHFDSDFSLIFCIEDFKKSASIACLE